MVTPKYLNPFLSLAKRDLISKIGRTISRFKEYVNEKIFAIKSLESSAIDRLLLLANEEKNEIKDRELYHALELKTQRNLVCAEETVARNTLQSTEQKEFNDIEKAHKEITEPLAVVLLDIGNLLISPRTIERSIGAPLDRLDDILTNPTPLEKVEFLAVDIPPKDDESKDDKKGIPTIR